MSLEWESQDLDQHWDDYADFHFNYHPKAPKWRPPPTDSDEEEKDEDRFVQLDPIEKVWDLSSEKIFISKRLISRTCTELAEGEEINISYGERANSFLLIEYGFTQADNRYDFVRFKGITIDKVVAKVRELGISVVELEESRRRLDEIKMKEILRCDLKLSGLHRDLLRLIRAALPNDLTLSDGTKTASEVQVLRVY
jgi:hypothetical protein